MYMYLFIAILFLPHIFKKNIYANLLDINTVTLRNKLFGIFHLLKTAIVTMIEREPIINTKYCMSLIKIMICLLG